MYRIIILFAANGLWSTREKKKPNPFLEGDRKARAIHQKKKACQ